MKLGDIINFAKALKDIKGAAILAQIATIGVFIAALLEFLGERETATQVRECTKEFGVSALPVCKEAFTSMADLLKDKTGPVLAMINTALAQVFFLMNRFGRKDEVAKKVLEEKIEKKELKRTMRNRFGAGRLP